MKGKEFSLPTVAWRDGQLRVIDQTLLPHRYRMVRLRTVGEVFEAIRSLRVRGAPAIGVAAAFGVALAALGAGRQSRALRGRVRRAIDHLARSRPTAVNLFWALARMRRVLARPGRAGDRPLEGTALAKALEKEARDIWDEDRVISRAMGRYGARLIHSGRAYLTHCNTGALATADFGTAAGIFYTAWAMGRRFEVFSTEARPLWQGLRLTVWELERARIPVTALCDSAAAGLLASGRISAVLVGADRIALNGDTANKVGTYGLAVLARRHRVPFYVVAPTSTFDRKIASGRAIPIEQRPAEEVTCPRGLQVAPKGTRAYNPAFDVTPAELITAFVTEHGIIKRPQR